jgi:serine/threonine-protein kinase
MPLEPGTRLGEYEVLSFLSAGGMGEVYRARDTRLGREVALKLLLDEVASDPERRARFEREARVLAALNHHNVATLYGFSSAMPQRGEGTPRSIAAAGAAAPASGEPRVERSFLVMELVAGETLADRIARGPLPPAEAIPIFTEIAAGLDAAHERGIVHRDLKPANVKFGPEGKVKILDFGLAKAMLPETNEPAAGSAAVGATLSPTLSYLATQRGEILGTAAYMSPEQASGRPVDRRTDVWAFGCCLYEALCARRPFAGSEFPEILASVLRDEPDWSLLPASTPPALRRLLARCLVKRTRDRLRDIGDARLELVAAAVEDPQPATPSTAASRRGVLLAIAFATGAALGALATLLVSSALRSGADATDAAVTRAAAPIVRSQILLPDSVSIPLGQTRGSFDTVHLAISPDGTEIVFVGRTEDGTRLYRRGLADFAPPAPIPGTENATFAFFSPDGRTLGFLAERKLKRVGIYGDDLRVLADAPNTQRAGWTEDGWIYWGDTEGFVLRRMRESGGSAETIAQLDGVLGDVLPDGRSVLLSPKESGRLSSDYGSVALLDLETLETRTLLESGYDARYAPPGHLVFGRGGNLLAVGFDAESRSVTGDPVTIVREVAMDSFFAHVQVAVSRAGSLIYLPGGDRALGTIASVDRDGTETLLGVEPRIFGALDLSDDDRRLALHVGDVADYIWIHDLERGGGQRLAGSAGVGWPLWSHHGDRLAITRQERGTAKLMVQEVAGGRPAHQVFEAPAGYASANAWAPDDQAIVVDTTGDLDLVVVDLDDPESTLQLGSASDAYSWAAFSPDGRWLIHGDFAGSGLWVRSYPDGELVERLALVDSGEFRWCGACGEIFFADRNGWNAMAVTTEPELRLGPPRLVFQTEFLDTMGLSYDVSSDGQRLYVLKTVAPQIRDRIHVVANLSAELERPAQR